MDISRYRDLFVSEAQEHLKVLSSLSMRCEAGTANDDSINEMFRHAHSLKGMAATMQLIPLTTLAHALEDLLTKLRDRKFVLSHNAVDLILAAIDTQEQMVALVAQGGELPDIKELANRIRSYTPVNDEKPEPSAAVPASAETTPTTMADAFPRVASSDTATTRIRTSLLDRLVTLSGELLTVRHTLENRTKELHTTELAPALKELSSLLRQLQNEVFQARMVPFAAITERYPRMVRDLARKSGKEIAFRIHGENIELDRGVLEQITEPLIHLLRNAVDHGLETPAERIANGKSPCGSLQISVSRQIDQVILEVTDDGRGMDLDRIRSKAVAKGLLDEQQLAALTQEELLLLICTPGFSTAATVTEISGRGVGMDVVRHAIQGVGGTLNITSIPGQGSTIALKLPISVAIIHALLVGCGDLLLAIPVSAITGTREVHQREVIKKGRQLYLEHDGQAIPLRNLPDFFRQKEPLSDRTLLSIVLTESNKQPVGLLVDRLLGQQEIFTRPLFPPLSDLRGISGSCLLGDGQIIFVVDPAACTGPVLAP